MADGNAPTKKVMTEKSNAAYSDFGDEHVFGRPYQESDDRDGDLEQAHKFCIRRRVVR